jgi:hypothetical protein
MLKKIALVLAVLIVVILVLAATRPDRFHVERTATVNAPPEAIFPLINDFHEWGKWSPYEKLDPGMRRTYDGAASGTGAVYQWDGNSQAGKGRMEIARSNPNSLVSIKLDFDKPLESHNVAQFTLQPRGTSTEVTWSMDGPNLFVGKVMGLFIDMDNMIGRDFETGLANLGAAARH